MTKWIYRGKQLLALRNDAQHDTAYDATTLQRDRNVYIIITGLLAKLIKSIAIAIVTYNTPTVIWKLALTKAP